MKQNISLSLIFFIIFIGVVILLAGNFNKSEKFLDICDDNGFKPLPVSCLTSSLRDLYIPSYTKPPQKIPQRRQSLMIIGDYMNLTDVQQEEYRKTLTPSQQEEFQAQYIQSLIQGLMAMSEYSKLTAKQKNDYLATLSPVQNYAFQNKYKQMQTQLSSIP